MSRSRIFQSSKILQNQNQDQDSSKILQNQDPSNPEFQDRRTEGENSAENNFIGFVVANQHFGSEQTLMKNSHWNLGNPLSFATVSAAPLAEQYPFLATT